MKQSRNLTTGQFSDDVKNAVRSSYNVEALPRLTGDWNLNRYYKPTADNIPSEDDEGFDIEAFPIESIYAPQRPTKGIAKALVGQAVAGRSYQRPNSAKFYVGSTDDVYQYWTSPEPTDATGTFRIHSDSKTIVRPHVLYPQVLKVNKIVVKMENTWATPNSYNILIRNNIVANRAAKDGWTAIGGTSPKIENDGTVTLYYNGTTWSTTRPDNLVLTDVSGIMVEVRTLKGGVKRDGTTTVYEKRGKDANGNPTTEPVEYNTTGAKSNFNLIAIEPHIEIDLTDRVVIVNDTFDMSESSQLYPIGTITTNQATISLANDDGLFNNENPASEFAGIVEPNVHFTLEYIYDIAGTPHSVQGFEMYATQWSGQSNETVDVSLEDSSKFLKEIKPRPALYEGKSFTEIVWRILDSVGFVDYEITEEDRVIEHTIPFFWTDGVKTAWELLDELAQATQSAIYFDSYGMLQVRTREAAFRDLDTPDWILRGEKSGTELADIIDEGLDISEEYEANKIDVTYKATKWKVSRRGKPALSKVWEPDTENVVLRSTPLVKTLNASEDKIWIDQKIVKIWPFVGKVNIEGEMIEYDGKQYVYYTGTGDGTKNWAIVKDDDERKKYANKSPDRLRSKNHYTGGLKIKERAIWNTEQRPHEVDVNNWNTRMTIATETTAASTDNPKGFNFNKKQSTVTIDTPGAMKDANDTFIVSRGGTTAAGYKVMGTKFRFKKDANSGTQRGGFGFSLDAQDDGYYVEATLTNKLDGRTRSSRNEIGLYSRNGKKWTLLDKAPPMAIAHDNWYELDAYIDRSGAQDVITVWLNGTKVAEATTTAGTKRADTAKMAMYARGRTKIEFEYIYGVNRNMTIPADDFGFYDLKYGGMRGGMWEREIVWRLKTRWKKISKKKSKKETYRWNAYMFDEFGPYVHEVREFDVKFEPNPVQYASLFSTNEWYAAPIEFNSNPFGAKFIIANVGRENAILHGEDSLIFGSIDRSVNQVLVVLGRNLQIEDDEKIKRKNAKAIRSRGPIEVELSSDWIQSKGMARDIANWMVKHWSEGVDEVTVEIFGNPLIEIGDVVGIEFPDKFMTAATHKYFVVGTSNDFESGVGTTLTLRRVRTAVDSDIS